jgi:ribosome maturation protein Sdo1
MPELKESFSRIHEGAVIIARIAVEDVDKLKAIFEADLYPDSNWILAEIIAAGNYNKYQELMNDIKKGARRTHH